MTRARDASLSAARAVTGDRPCDILLIQPPIRDFYLTVKRTLPYGLLSIAAVLRQEGFRVALLDALARGKSRPQPLPAPLDDLSAVYPAGDLSPFALFSGYHHFGYALDTVADLAGRSGAFLIGISSLFSTYEDMALACAQAVKKRCPEAFVVLGGHHPTVFPDRILDHPGIDFVLRGDGEATLPSLAKALQRHTGLAEVPGIAFDDPSGRRHINPPVYARDLNQFPTPPLDLLNTRYYRRKGGISLAIAASRGCPMTCSYCCMGARSKIPYRRRSVAHVLGEIARAAGRHAIGMIDFEDENLSMDRDWFADLLFRITDLFAGYPPELRAMNGLYPPSLDASLVRRMRRAGFLQLNLSLATCNPRQLERFHRKSVNRDVDRVLGWAEQNGMTAVGYLIAGAPDQDPLASVEDLLFLAPRRVLAGLSIYYPAPDSLDFIRCRVSGLLPASPLAWRSSALPIDHVTHRLHSATLLRLTRALNFMKQCVDTEGRLPAPASMPDPPAPLSGNRYAIGRQLLRWFLADGVLRRVDALGRVTDCPADAVLTRAFLHGIQKTGLRGVRT